MLVFAHIVESIPALAVGNGLIFIVPVIVLEQISLETVNVMVFVPAPV